MKKLLEILQYGETDIRFRTDIDVEKHPEQLENLAPAAAFAMMTSLFGGNEQSVLAVIRALSIADLAVSVNRREMISELDEISKNLARCLEEAKAEMVKRGAKILEFGPGVAPSKTKS